MLYYQHPGFKIEMFNFEIKIVMNEKGDYDNDMLHFSLPGAFNADEFPLVYGYLNSIGVGFSNSSQFNRDMIRALALLLKPISEISRYMVLNAKQDEEIENNMYG
ncbi:hypothetical protein [Acidiplasma sp.]|uniref:hypothetical protein n=1 Tax=Acidiplasma sp. TaxID=1872114 RepID=UPI002589A76C|nr:hypothetical protein [Acidiplasma sp.]